MTPHTLQHSSNLALRLALLGALTAPLVACDDATSTGTTGAGGDDATSASIGSSSSVSTTASSASSGTGGAAATSWADVPGAGEGARVVATSSGDPVFIGTTNQPTEFGLGVKPKGGYVLRTDRDGKPLWSRALASAGQVQVRTADSRDGMIVVGGFHNDAISFDDGTPSIPAPTNGGGAFLVALDEAGKVLFSRAFTNTATTIGNQQVVDVSISGTGKIAVLAALAGTVDFGEGPTTCEPGTTRLLFYSTDNAYLATRVAPLSLVSIVATATEDIYAIGRFNGTVQLGMSNTITSNGAGDAVVVHVSPELEIADVLTFGGAAEDGFVDAHRLPGGGIAMVGSNDSPIDFGVGTVEPGLFYVETDVAAKITKSRRFATIELGQGFPFEVSVAPDGAYAITGYTSAALDLGTGKLQPASYDSFYGLYDANGAAKDAFILGNADPNVGPALRGLTLTEDDAFLAGSLVGNATVDGISVPAPDGGILHARLVR